MGYRPHIVKTYIVEYGKTLNSDNWDIEDFIEFLDLSDINYHRSYSEESDIVYIDTEYFLSILKEERIENFKKTYSKDKLKLSLEEYIENIENLYEAAEFPDIQKRNEIIIEWF